MPYYLHDLGLNILETALEALNACAPTCQDPTHYCDFPSQCNPPSAWECEPTIICEANREWNCSPTRVCVPPSAVGKVAGACGGNSCFSASRLVIQLQAVGSLDQLQDELRGALAQVQAHQQRIEESMTAEQLETLRKHLDEKLRRVDTELKKRNK